jgi:ATP-independent RNA helicase DbpA
MHPPAARTFASLGLAPAFTEALAVLGFASMTPVQEHALPPLLRGRDVIAQARTGSGKTVAFGLALLARVDVERARTQALVLCPTRELATQVGAELRRLARFVPNLRVVVLGGGVPVRTQLPSLQTPPHVVVGTPGRILDHLARGTLSFGALRVLVLDEADRMLDMGFRDAIDTVVQQVPKTRQTMLFSATWPDDIRALSRALQTDAVDVTIDDTRDLTVDGGPASSDIDEVFYDVGALPKVDALATLLLHHRPASALVFCTTKVDVREVTADLRRRGFAVLALHGDLEQRARDEVLVRFANRSCAVLVATDVAARGLDVKDLAAVVSFELPHDADVHTHRVGRTGRAGKKGLALALCTPRERHRATAIADATGRPLRWSPLPPPSTDQPTPAPMTTLLIEGGKQDKLRAGDVLGALTGDVGLPGEVVGRIDIGARHTWVAVRTDSVDVALRGLRAGRIKNKTFRVWRDE